MRIKGSPSTPPPTAPTDRASLDGEPAAGRSRFEKSAFEPVRGGTVSRKVTLPTALNVEPALVKAGGKLPTYTEVKGTLWSGTPTADQVQQGEVGDCFYLSSLASMAQRQPELLQSAIHDNGNGTYTVKLYQPQKDGTFKPTAVTVDDKIPEMADGSVAYGGAPDEKSTLWVSIAEKAFAKLNRGYTVIDQGGDERDAMSALTGKPSMGMDLSPAKADAIYGRLQKAIAGNKLTTAGTYAAGDINKALAGFRRQGLDPSFDPKTFSYDKYGVVDSHAYTVTGVSTDATGQKYVELRNPWGETEPVGADGKGDGVDDGKFKMKLQDFCCLYQEVAIGG
jgi:hypothetical protein